MQSTRVKSILYFAIKYKFQPLNKVKHSQSKKNKKLQINLSKWIGDRKPLFILKTLVYKCSFSQALLFYFNGPLQVNGQIILRQQKQFNRTQKSVHE